MILDKMKKFAVCAVLFLTLLATSPASGNCNKEGFKVTKSVEKLFYGRFIIDEDFGRTNFTIEIKILLILIKLPVSARVDAGNNVSCFTTYRAPGKTAQNSTEQENVLVKEKIFERQLKDTSKKNMSLSIPKTTIAKQHVIQQRSEGDSSSMLKKVWNKFSNSMQSILEWLWFDGPKSINSDKFAWRNITRSDLTHGPGDGEIEFCKEKFDRHSTDSQWFAAKLWSKGVAAMRWIVSNETQEKALNFMNFYWTRLQSRLINWTSQHTFYVMMFIWLIDYCFMAVYLTTQYISNIIVLLINRIRRCVANGEPERLRQLELERKRMAQAKPWRPKPHKKRRPNYCGRLQKW